MITNDSISLLKKPRTTWNKSLLPVWWIWREWKRREEERGRNLGERAGRESAEIHKPSKEDRRRDKCRMSPSLHSVYTKHVLFKSKLIAAVAK